MRELDNQELTKEIQNLQIANASLLSSIPIIHALGYGLMLLSLINSLEILIPFNFFDSFWILSALERIIAQIPLTLIGLILIFYGKNLYRNRSEKKVLKFIHFLVLCIGVLLFFLIPLSLLNNASISAWSQEQLAVESDRQIIEIKQIKDELESIDTESALSNFLTRSLTERLFLQEFSAERLALKKYRIANLLDKEAIKISDYSRKVNSDNYIKLTKTNIKSTLSFLVDGILFIFIWRNNKWLEF
jgi:hypothetical protein